MITSRQNPFLKQIKSLSQKKYRDENSLYLVESIKLVNEAIDLALPVKAIVGTERGLSHVKANQVKVEVLSDDLFKSVSNEVTPQGVLALIEKPDLSLKPCSGNCLLLDGVSDPNNVGAIIRTAAATGFNNLYITSDCADPYSPKSVRASMGGIFRVKVYLGSREDLIKTINQSIVVADMKGKNLFDVKAKEDICLVIGNEGKGVSELIKNKADITVSIPMKNGMESLNASVSAGIIMYALTK